VPPRTPFTIVAAFCVLIATAACATTQATYAGRPVETTTPPVATTSSVAPTPTPSATTTSPSVKPTSGTPTSKPTLTLQDYLNRIPTFPAAPTPIPVTLPHTAGHAAWTHQIPTTQPVAFLTIDDGVTRLPIAMDLMRAAKIPVTLFLTTNTISPDKQYFAKLQNLGAVIEDHTISHPDLSKLSYDAQKNQLCHSTDLLGQWYGRRPVFFRPPYGNKNDDTLRAAWDCGLQAGFHWKETVNDGVVRYQTSVHKIQPGDIILMHFRPAFAADFVAALRAIKAAGLVPALLEDYVRVEGVPPTP
jgi:peptidoglycan/xylan/chitin deacetylase (PgdA/CDA1 family)